MNDEDATLIPHLFIRCEERHDDPPMDEHCICGRDRDDEIHKVAEAA